MWKICLKCQGLYPEDARGCPNCAPKGSALRRWVRGAVGAAGISVLGATAACGATAPIVGASADAGVRDSGSADSGSADSGSADSGSPGSPDSGNPDSGVSDAGTDGGVLKCVCPVLAAYGNFGPCDGEPVAPDAGCPGGETPMCSTCP